MSFITINQGQGATVNVTAGQSITLNNSAQSKGRIEIASGPGAGTIVNDYHVGNRTYGPFEAGSISLGAIVGALQYRVLAAGATPNTGNGGDSTTGLPPGGTAGQVLVKQSETDGDVEWQNPPAGEGAVDSVNGQTGVVTLAAADVGAAAASHSHAQSDVTGLVSALASKADGAATTAALGDKLNAASPTSTGIAQHTGAFNIPTMTPGGSVLESDAGGREYSYSASGAFTINSTPPDGRVFGPVGVSNTSGSAITRSLPAIDGLTWINDNDGATLAEISIGANSRVEFMVRRLGSQLRVIGLPVAGGGSFDIATQEEAEAGTDNTKGMTPLRTAQAIAALAEGDPLPAVLQGIADLTPSEGDFLQWQSGAWALLPFSNLVVAVAEALEIDSVPAAFTAGQWSVTDTTEGGEIEVTVSELPSDGGSAITAVQYSLDGGAFTAFSTPLSTTGTRTITGLTDDQEYDIQLRAVNAIGNGAASDIKQVTPTAASGGPAPGTYLFTQNTGGSPYSNAVVDTWINFEPANQDTNYSTDTRLRAEYRIDGEDRWSQYILIRADDLMNLAGGTASAAEIGLTNSYDVGGMGATVTFEVFPLLRNVNFAQATWNNYASGSPWATPGAEGVGDIGASIASASYPNNGATLVVNSGGLVSGINALLANPSAYQGFLIKITTNQPGAVSFVSSEGDDGQRPYISVTIS